MSRSILRRPSSEVLRTRVHSAKTQIGYAELKCMEPQICLYKYTNAVFRYLWSETRGWKCSQAGAEVNTALSHTTHCPCHTKHSLTLVLHHTLSLSHQIQPPVTPHTIPVTPNSPLSHHTLSLSHQTAPSHTTHSACHTKLVPVPVPKA